MNTESANLRVKIDARIDAMIEQLYREVDGFAHQRDSKEINLDYYKRHNVETVLRIRHKRMIDALVIHYFTKHDPVQAKAWAEYTEDEMLHGQMFAKDLERLFGMRIEEVYAHEPLFATKLLNGFFYFTLEHEGPMAPITSAYFLESLARKTQPAWLDNLSNALGEQNVRGARAHVNHDIMENHNDFVWNVLYKTIKKPEDVRRLEQYLENIFSLFVAYFVEVYAKTMGNNASDNIRRMSPVVAVEYAS